MNFTGISIYLISARFYSVIQDLLHHFKNSELGETIPGAVCKAEPRRACSSGAMREGRGRQGLPIGGRVATVARSWVRSRVSPECEHPSSHWLLALSYYTLGWWVSKKNNPYVYFLNRYQF